MECPAVPGADYLATFQEPFVQRAAAMGTLVVDGEYFPLRLEESNGPACHPDFQASVFGQFGQAGNHYEVIHEPSSLFRSHLMLSLH
jgi:hypothetical protein